MRGRVWIAAVVLSMSSWVAFGANTGTLRVFVKDATGAAVAQSVIVARRDAPVHAEASDAELRKTVERVALSDNNGAYTTELPPGYYDVVVSMAGFDPVCRKVRVHRGLVVEFLAHLTANAEYVNEYGFKVLAEPKKK